MKKILTCLLLLCSLIITAQHHDNVEETIFKINLERKVPSEGKHTVPLPNGSSKIVVLKENHTIDNCPDHIKTYDVYDNKEYIGTYTHTLHGVWYYLYMDGEPVSIYPKKDMPKYHVFEKGISGAIECGVDDHFQVEPHSHEPSGVQRRLEGVKKVYRIALATTAEFFTENGSNMTTAEALVVSTIQGVNAVYRRELSVEFNLIGYKIYTNASTQPFDPNDGLDRTLKAGNVINDLYEVSSYDVGHVLNTNLSDVENDPWENGGLAKLAVVCKDRIYQGSPIKAQGWSGGFSNSGYRWINIVSHELGHMFSAEHTFNGIGSACTDAISEGTAYEIGSGSSIMSYNGVCEEGQNINERSDRDLFFHVHSLHQMRDYILSVATCANETANGVSDPQVNANPDNIEEFKIPKGTPFYLNGEVSEDANGTYSYSWEQIDEDGANSPTQGKVGTQASNDPRAPLFRCYPPDNKKDRYFPALNNLKNGISSYPFEALSNVRRDINMCFITRINTDQGGAFGRDTVTLKVQNSGPLRTSNISNWNTGTSKTINWNINNSGDLCDKVDIELSLDGGLTYTYLLASDIDYDAESAELTLPEFIPSTDKCRIKIACADYENFKIFTINNNDFRIVNSCNAGGYDYCPAGHSIVAEVGSPEANLEGNYSLFAGDAVSTLSNAVNNGSDNFPVVIKDGLNGNGCWEAYSSRDASFNQFTVSESGLYTFRIDDTSAAVFSILDGSYVGNENDNACSKFITSNAYKKAPFFSYSNRISVELDACTTYTLLGYYFDQGSSGTIGLESIQGPGTFYLIDHLVPTVTQFYIAVNENNIVKAAQQTLDFRMLGRGKYNIYAVSTEGDFNSDDWNNQNIDNVSLSECFTISKSSISLELTKDCNITEAKTTSIGDCDPANGTFNVTFETIYSEPPSNDAQLHIGDATFAVTNSPQTETIMFPAQGESMEVEVYLSNEENCKTTLSIQQPENCCPYDIAIPAKDTLCVGSPLTLNIGNLPNASVQWYKDGQKLDGSTNPTLSVIEGGVYSVEVIKDGCLKRAQTEIVSSMPESLDYEGDVTFCEGVPNTITITPYNPNFEYNWTFNGAPIEGNDDSKRTIYTAGQLSCMVTNSFGCTSEVVIICNTTPAPNVDLGEDIFACSGDDVTLEADITGDFDTANWSNAQGSSLGSGNSIVVNSDGKYFITLTTSTCEVKDSILVTFEETATIQAPEFVDHCAGGMTTIEIETNSNLVKWFINDNTTSTQEGEGKTFTFSEAQSIRVVAGASELCSATATINVNTINLPQIELGETKVACIGSQIQLQVIQGSGSYIWKKDGSNISETSNSITVDEGGLYEVVYTEGECMISDTVTVRFDDKPNIDPIERVEFCKDGSTVITPITNGTSYLWEKQGSTLGMDASYTVSEEGLYTFTSSFDGECPNSISIQVFEVDPPTVDLPETLTICQGDQATIEGPLGNYTYDWKYNNQSIGDNQAITVDQAGSYTLEVTDPLGCSTMKEVTLSLESPPTTSLEDQSISLCNGDATQITFVSDANTIVWYKDGDLFSVENPKDVSLTEGGVYTVSAYNTEGCSNDKTVSINIIEAPVFNITGNTTSCAGTPISLTVDGNANTYSWTNEAGTEIGQGTTVEFTESTKVTITGIGDACSTTRTIDVVFSETPTLEVANTTIDLCTGETKSINCTTNGDSIVWFKNGVVLDNQIGTSLDVSEGGTYIIDVYNTAGCKSSESIAVTAYDIPEIDLDEMAALCPGESITLNIDLKTGESISWSNGETSSIINIAHSNTLEQKTYELMATITNAGSCTASDKMIITEYPKAQAVITAPQNFLCKGDSLILNGTGSDMVSWVTTSSFDDLGEGKILIYPTESTTYTLNTQSTQCPQSISSETLDITVYEPEEMTAGVDTCLIKGQEIELQASGAISYEWFENNTITSGENSSTPSIAPKEDATYKVLMTDTNGCKLIDEVNVCVYADASEVLQLVTAITPNGDNMNDELTFKGLDLFKENYLTIYNRWGDIIYEKANYQRDQERFSGLLGTDLVPAGTYYYVLTIDGITVKNALVIIR